MAWSGAPTSLRVMTRRLAGDMSVAGPTVSDMATWEDVRRIAMALPETVERASPDGVLEWRVKDKLFAWERPLRKRISRP